MTLKLKTKILLLVCICTLGITRGDRRIIPNSETESYVVFGKKADISNFPYQLSLSFLKDDTTIFNCGAVIISEKFGLSAAHCVHDEGLKPENVQIRAGSNFVDEGGVTTILKKFIIHKNYEKTKLDYDIAVLEFLNPLKFNNFTQPIKLPEQNQELEDETKCTVSGFGRTEDGTYPDHLLFADISKMSSRLCQRTYSLLPGNPKITKSMICAADVVSNADICGGDSGGPLKCDNTLFGIVSFNHENCNYKLFPGVYANVAYFRDWIKEHTGI